MVGGGGKSIFERQGFRIDMKPLIINGTSSRLFRLGLHEVL